MSGNSSPAIRQIGSLLTKQCEFGDSWVLVDLVISKTYCIFIAQDKELRTLRQRASTVRDCSATRTGHAASLAGTFAFNNGYRPHMSIGYETSSLAHQEEGGRNRMWKQKKYVGNLSSYEESRTSLPCRVTGQVRVRARTAKLFMPNALKSISGPDRQHVRTAACQGTVVCKERQYDFCLTVYFFRMTFCKVSTVSVYKEKKCLVKSEKAKALDL